MFWLLLGSAHRVSRLSVSHSAPTPTLVGRLGVGKMKGGDTARTADTNRLKGCPIPYNIMLSNKACGGRTGVLF